MRKTSSDGFLTIPGANSSFVLMEPVSQHRLQHRRAAVLGASAGIPAGALFMELASQKALDRIGRLAEILPSGATKTGLVMGGAMTLGALAALFSQ